MNYTEALAKVGDTSLVSFAGGRSRYAVFSQDGDDILVRLFQTDILVFHPDDTVTIDTGGYNTATTREALRALLPSGLSVSTRQRVLYLYGAGPQIAVTDGMRVARGRVVKTGRPVPLDMTMRRALRRPSRGIVYFVDLDTGLIVSQLGAGYAWPILDFAGMGPEDGFQTHYGLEYIAGNEAWRANHTQSLGILGAVHVTPELRLTHQAFWIEHRRAHRGIDAATASAS